MESLLKDDNALSPFPALEVFIPLDSLPIVEVVEATFGHVLSSKYDEVISQFGVSFTKIMPKFHISLNPKVNILLHHIPQFIRMTQVPLGLFSEEVVEEQHKFFFPIL